MAVMQDHPSADAATGIDYDPVAVAYVRLIMEDLLSCLRLRLRELSNLSRRSYRTSLSHVSKTHLNSFPCSVSLG
ncbi:hypothetical protein E2562_032863 [Oryza meyeriana var. granulata]|uniref:Uncharacterized protein n=1 Tax=Oryza meyeriana var. granulata TaxID=110450 RepID=A0A6G1BPA8_9ORYZ|nr:hypothetical protein E2562_032863 [Oryza meyeriana var. granulata]